MTELDQARHMLAQGASLQLAARAGGFDSAAALDLSLWRHLGGEMEMHPPRAYKAWTMAEQNRLTADWSAHPTRAIAEALGRSVDSVSKRASELGLRKTGAGRYRR